MQMPNFLVIGAAKAGTSALYRFLNEHPDIYMSPVKEPRFFSFEGDEFSADHPLHKTTITRLEDYQALFDGVKKESAIGEASPSYLFNPRAPERIEAYLPEARLIAVLRNPVERAYSHFLHLVKVGVEPSTDFAAVLRDEEGLRIGDWVPRRDYLSFGFYHDQLGRYFDRFPDKQIKVYLHEELIENPRAVLRDIFGFLNVDDTYIPDYQKRINVSGVPRSRVLRNVLDKPNIIRSTLRRCVPARLRQEAATILRRKNLVRPEMTKALHEELLETYRSDILQLQSLIDRDLSLWLKSSET